MAATREDFDLRDMVMSMGGSIDEILKGAAIDARDFRNANKAVRDELDRMRHEADVQFKARQAATGEQRLALQRETYTQTGEERRARRESRQAQYDRTQQYREEQAEYRRERDAERMAYRQAQDAARARRQARGGGLELEAPTVSTGTQGVIPSGGGWAPNKESVAKFIIFASVLGAVGAVANDIVNKTPPMQIKGAKVPAHLRGVGGSFIAGVIALIVNEVWPAAGAVMGAGIVGLVVIPNWTPLLGGIGNVLSSKGGTGKSSAEGDLSVGPLDKAATAKWGHAVYRLANGSLWSPDAKTNTALQGLVPG